MEPWFPCGNGVSVGEIEYAYHLVHPILFLGENFMSETRDQKWIRTFEQPEENVKFSSGTPIYEKQ